ncbi:unnamed protein product [Chironomus riparius]|uniref:Uncharacterized protein n=1 Tax=Chironomus riparius TaxID=315576 RepID=A0A9N9RIG6_9DIPT|nr:unnamed protein product [Chironomus riparius]
MSVDKTTNDAKHFGDVTSMCYYNEHLFSAGSDAKIKIWNKDLTFVNEINIHEAHIYCIITDKTGRLYSSSCDGTIKSIEQPLTSSRFTVVLQHENEIEALFADDDLTFYCGDDKGGITIFKDGKFQFMMNIVEHVKGLFVEKGFVYTLALMDLSIHEIRSQKYIMKGSVPGKFPVTLFGEKIDGRSKYIAIATRDGLGIAIICNKTFKIIETKEHAHDMIINYMKGFGDILFSCDYAGKVVKYEMMDGKLIEIASVSTGSGCANCIEVVDDKIVYVGSNDGTVKRINFN